MVSWCHFLPPNRTKVWTQVNTDQIKQAVFEAMQDAEELGGPELPEYIELMEAIAQECRQRADNARDLQGKHKLTAQEFEACMQGYPPRRK